jgi:hypothetical protein
LGVNSGASDVASCAGRGGWGAEDGHRISSNVLVKRKLNAEITATIMKITTESAAAKP